MLKYLHNNNHRFLAIMQVNLHYPAPPVKNWRNLLVQSFTALADSNQCIQISEKTLHWSSPQQCCLHCLHTIICVEVFANLVTLQWSILQQQI